MRKRALALAIWAIPSMAQAQTMSALSPAGSGLPANLGALDKAPPFVAQMVVTDASGHTSSFRIFHETGRIRIEPLSGRAGAQGMVSIVDLPDKVMYSGIGNMWFKVSLSRLNLSTAVAQAKQQVSLMKGYRKRPLGQESIDGKLCTGEEMASPDGATVIDEWKWGPYPIGTRIHDSHGTTTVELRSLRPQQTPDADFRVPAGVRIMDMSDMLRHAGAGASGLPLPGALPDGGSAAGSLQELMNPATPNP